MAQRGKGKQHQNDRDGDIEFPPAAQLLVIEVSQHHGSYKAQPGGNDLHQHGPAADDAHLLDAEQQHHAEGREPQCAAKHHRIDAAEQAAKDGKHGGASFRARGGGCAGPGPAGRSGEAGTGAGGAEAAAGGLPGGPNSRLCTSL